VNGLFGATNFALDLTAPVEGASASFDHFAHFGAVAASAAHQIASVDADGRLVAGASLRSSDAEFDVALAEIGRMFVVHQILLRWRLVFGIVRFELVVVLLATVARHSARVADEHPRGSVETILQVVAHHAEERQPHPTGAHRARSRHAVTLALLTHFS
jgi:hypothetical protein